jgi:hypothetical protein
MSDERFPYESWVAEALTGVLARALREVSENGVAGDHHFYVNFRTDEPGVKIPEFLRAQYPEEITIVLQYQFEELNIDDEGFAVTLSFSGNRHRLYVPFESVSSFTDPSVGFSLQMQPQFLLNDSGQDDDETASPTGEVIDHDTAFARNRTTDSEDTPADEEKGSADVIALDAFRNKK